jgi:hypothetical protein
MSNRVTDYNSNEYISQFTIESGDCKIKQNLRDASIRQT